MIIRLIVINTIYYVMYVQLREVCYTISLYEKRPCSLSSMVTAQVQQHHVAAGFFRRWKADSGPRD